METVIIKMKPSYFLAIFVYMNQLTIDEIETNNIILKYGTHTALLELRKLLQDVAFKNRGLFLNGENAIISKREKPVIKKIPNSYALLFFSIYGGTNVNGFFGVSCKEMCRQIEKQLFKSGQYMIFQN